ncbi:siderophore-interacting protein [Aquamicrobium sp. LC103]|uniref:siderophore-interacting protein n=1 Tax=Aquamicrobium sp. LC103 TaxID=1120658 RepID=UPI00063E7EF7|nr:siderophore-interacting protein [Aquamicrobium sp. LC103]TKT76175.1 siderophore-interacting protein [Aquamicrobium sp. LC103]
MIEARPYRIFNVKLAKRETLSPHFARLTFAGADVHDMTTYAPDQRIKLFFPYPDGRNPDMDDRPDWYTRYKARPISDRAPMRTYTIRQLRADAGEVDIDFVMHADGGPAVTWAANAKTGDPLQISAPNRTFTGECGGYEWQPPKGVQRVLLIADETAVPAVAGILEELAALPSPPATDAYLEIPTASDQIDVARWEGLNLRWLAREETGTHVHGALMENAAAGAMKLDLAHEGAASAATDDEELIWDRASEGDPRFYAWFAGESASIGRIRKLLAKGGIDKRQTTLMGYWKFGRTLD